MHLPAVKSRSTVLFMQRATVDLCVSTILVFAFLAAAAAPSADELLGKAKEQAAKEQKSIFVDFSASW